MIQDKELNVELYYLFKTPISSHLICGILTDKKYYHTQALLNYFYFCDVCASMTLQITKPNTAN